MGQLTWEVLQEELEHGGPHVNTVEFFALIIAGIIFSHFLFKFLIYLVSKFTKINDKTLSRVVRGIPPLMGIVIGIGWTTSVLSLRAPDFVLNWMTELMRTVWTLTATLFIAHVCSEYLKYKMGRNNERLGSTSILATAIDCTVYAVGILLLLESFGISISPLLTAMGVGGLASALALQDTLTNLFSGITTLVSKQVRIGDYVKLSTGEEGRIIDLNWRNTTIRTATNNLVIVPNKTVANATITNYEQPLAECSITIPVTVVYGSDLDQVESVALEEARHILEHSEYGVTGFEPKVRFTELGEYGISFKVTLRIKNVLDEAILKHQYIKRLYKRFNEEGIEILVRQD
ncbi:MAG: mechanosensitive ion channel family protein [Veillonella sp.]|nr:mechanosensitive ion channel family protein [Veillonella sp.]